MTINTQVTILKGVGDELAKKLAAAGIKTVGDLVDNYPRRYEDYSHIVPIGELKPGTITIR